MTQPVDYGCPECGFGGPHPVVEKFGSEGMFTIVRCGKCSVEYALTAVTVNVNKVPGEQSTVNERPPTVPTAPRLQAVKST